MNIKSLVENNIIFQTISGSHAYGTNTPESDLDLRGVCIIPNKSYYLGIGINSFEQADSMFDGDTVIYDIRKAIKLIADGNPNMCDLVFTDPQFYKTISQSWQKVIDNRDKFLSKKMRHTYVGYAFAQLKRIQRHRNYLMNPPKAKPQRADYGLPERSLISADDLGALLYLISGLLKDSIEEFNLSDLAKEEFKQVNWIGLVQAKAHDKDLEQAVKQVSGFSDELVDIAMREKRYKAACNEWDSYKNWEATRNEKRRQLEAKFGYDTKHASHLVRLLRMGEEIFIEKTIKVFRPDREELLSIRNGAWSYEEIIEYAEVMQDKVVELASKSNLPNTPNYNFFDNLCIEIIEEYLSEK